MKFSTRRFVVGLAVLSGLFFAVMLSLFFYGLATTTSEYSVGGVAAPHQFFHNFLYGRTFQTSLYASKLAGASVGFSHNPYAYIHTYVIHVYLTPFLFAPVWNLWPNLYWLYGLVFLVNYAGMVLFAWKTLEHLSPQSFKIKTVTATALLLAGGFLATFQEKAQLMLFGGPFLLAAFYFLLTRRKVWFFAAMVLTCLTSEDLAMVAVTFSLYIFLFERKAKSYALLGGLFAVVYLVIVLFFIQPAARSELVLTNSTTTVVVFEKIREFFPPDIGLLLISFAPALFFFPAFGIVCLLFGKPDVSWWRVGGLVFLAPLPHWGQTAIVGAAHHMAPVILFVFAAFVLVLGKTPDRIPHGIPLPRKTAAFLLAITAFFLLGSFRILAGNLPDFIIVPIYKLAGREEKAQKLEQGFAEKEGNRRVLEVVDSIPKESSLVFLTNSSVEGFIAGRSDLWKFPDYYDVADFLVIQPNANQSFFSLPSGDGLNFPQALAGGKDAELDDAHISEEAANAIIHHLVSEKKSHRLVLQESNVVLLERIEKKPVYSSPSTLGLGWVPALSQLFNPKQATE